MDDCWPSLHRPVFNVRVVWVIVTYIKINHLRRAGHVIRVEEQNPVRRALVAVVEGTR